MEACAELAARCPSPSPRAPTKIHKLILPEINAREAVVVDGVSVYPGRSLMDVVHMLNTGNGVQPLKVDTHALLDAVQQ